jgi:hypothetical protein
LKHCVIFGRSQPSSARHSKPLPLTSLPNRYAHAFLAAADFAGPAACAVCLASSQTLAALRVESDEAAMFAPA